MADDRNITIAKQAFSEIRTRFSHLRVIEDTNVNVDLSITFPIQPGLKHQVNLNLQSDELHFSVFNFLLEWFPCTAPDVVQDYIAAVSGFLSGEYRILEVYVGDKCLKAKLQSPEKSGWKTIGTWSTGWRILLFTKKVYTIVRNV